MAVLPVLTWGDPRLKKNSLDVGDWTKGLRASGSPWRPKRW